MTRSCRRTSRGLVLVASSLACAMTGACNREKAEAGRIVAEATNAYQQLKPQAAQLQSTLADVRKGVEELAEEVPSAAEWRGRLLATDEVVGVLDGKLKWLSSQLDEAKNSEKVEQAVQLKNEIAATGQDLRQMQGRILALTHEKAHFQRLAALLAAPYERALSTGYRLKAAKDGVESHLMEFIQDAKRKVDKTTWFDFDRLVFKGTGAELDILDSKSQLDNVVQILAAYPSVALKIGGYTDKTTDAAADKKRSSDLALAVTKALVQTGVPPARLQAEGLGSAPNRRVALLVTTK